jgi:hypothetical protein
MVGAWGLQAVRSRRRALGVALLIPLLALPGLAQPSAAAEPGTITGTITDDQGDPLEDASVFAIPTTFDFDLTVAETGADGTYELEVRAGYYRVEVMPPAGSDLAPERYDDSYGSPTPVLVNSAAETSGIDAQLEIGATVTGTVTDAEGDPVNGARVDVQPWWDAPGFLEFTSDAPSDSTNASGQYEIIGLPPTRLLLHASPSAGRPDLADEWYLDAYSPSQAKPVQTTLGATTPGINIQLGPGGGISGTVTDPDGDPMAGVEVFAQTLECCEGNGTSTGADGTYELELAPGDYYVQFYPETGGVLPEYYDDRHTFQSADILTIGEGDDLTGIDAQFDVPSSLSGRVVGLSGRGAGGVQVIISDDQGNEYFTGTNRAGTWSHNRLPGGNYTVQFVAEHATAWWEDELHPDGAATIVLPEGGSVGNIDATLDQIVIGQNFTDNDTVVFASCAVGDPATFQFEVGAFDTSDGTTAGSIDFGDGTPTFPFSAAGASVSHTYTWGGGASTGPASEVVVTLTGGPANSDSYTIIPAYTPCGGGGVSFSDVPASHPFAAEIECLVDLGVTDGFSDGTFRPGARITRQAVVAWLWRLAGAPSPSVLPEFSDVPEGHPFADAIAWAAGRNIVNGFPDGTFHPGAEVTRQAVAAWAWRYVFSPSTSLPTGFSDVPNDHPFARPIAWAAHSGIASGFADGTFRPDQRITRQAVAAWMCRLAAYEPGFSEG